MSRKIVAQADSKTSIPYGQNPGPPGSYQLICIADQRPESLGKRTLYVIDTRDGCVWTSEDAAGFLSRIKYAKLP